MKRGAAWPIGVALALGGVVAGNIWVMRIASGDPSFAVEPEYYRRALAWDSIAAQARASSLLGWRVTAHLDPFTAGNGARLSVRLADSSGATIRGADITVDALFVARAAEIHTVSLAEDASGLYSAQLPVRFSGQWELRLRARRGGALYTTTSRIEAVAADAP
jgi:nitrogen fixation protein FixH